jgi:hypothetical protein
MNLIEKRDFIHNHLSKIDEQLVNEVFEKLKAAIDGDDILKEKLSARAIAAEKDINNNDIYTRKEVEKLTSRK